MWRGYQREKGTEEREREKCREEKDFWGCGVVVRTFSFLFFFLFNFSSFGSETGEKKERDERREKNKEKKKKKKLTLQPLRAFCLSLRAGKFSLLCSLFLRERVQFSPVASACTRARTERRERETGREKKKRASLI